MILISETLMNQLMVRRRNRFGCETAKGKVECQKGPASEAGCWAELIFLEDVGHHSLGKQPQVTTRETLRKHDNQWVPAVPTST